RGGGGEGGAEGGGVRGSAGPRVATSGGVEVVGRLESLVRKSLLRREEAAAPGADPAPRFGMLETIREFAIERLAASGEKVAIERRHAEYYAALAEYADEKILTTQQRSWLDRLAAEPANLR